MSHTYSSAPSSSGGSVNVAATTSVGRHVPNSNSVNANSVLASGTFNISGDVLVSSSSAPSNSKQTESTKNPRPGTARKPPPTIDNFWQNIVADVRNINQVDAKHQALPLARIKKIMKLDENAKMIAAEAPLLFAKACEYFIQELTMRAWIHTEESKRRTLQRSDIAQAIANYDQFDFLIDIVPREDIKPSASSGTKKDSSQQHATVNSTTSTPAAAAVMTAGTVTLPLKMETADGEVFTFSTISSDAIAASAAQQHHPQQAHTTMHQPQQLQIIQQPSTTHPQQMQYFIATPEALNAVHGQNAAPQQQLQIIQQAAQPQYFITTHQPQQLILTAGPNGQLTATPAPANTAQQQQAAILQNLAQQQQQQQQPQIQVLQQVVSPAGEITNVPIAINANQLNLLRLQMQPNATQQLLQLNTTANAPATTSHTVTAAQIQAQQHHAQQQQQQHQQPHVSAGAANIFISATPHVTAAQHQHHQQQHQQQVQQQQQHQHINLSGASIVATDRTLGGTYRPNC